MHRPLGYENYATFHPTFLYELLWDFGGVAVLLLVDRRFKIRPPALFALYVSIYTSFRMFEETLRIDPSHHFLGMRVNFWVSLVLFVVSTGFFVWWQLLRGRRRRRRRAVGPKQPTMAIPKGRVRPGR